MPKAAANPPRVPTPIYRMVHMDCLETLLARDAVHAPNHAPEDGLPYVGIHATQTQIDRGEKRVPCGPGGIILDYVGFYFGPHSPMLYRLHTGYNVSPVAQKNIIYLVSSAQAVQRAGLGFVFYDGHSLAAFSDPFADLAKLTRVDWDAVGLKVWKDTANDPDRQRRKQAEFLVHGMMPWQLVKKIGAYDAAAKARIRSILADYPDRHHPVVLAKKSWYY